MPMIHIEYDNGKVQKDDIVALSNTIQKIVSETTKIEDVFVSTPDQFVGDVMGDLFSRRAQISGTETRGVPQVVEAFVPLSELQGYATALRSVSQGRASSYMEASHYAEVPVNIVQQIIAKQGKNSQTQAAAA